MEQGRVVRRASAMQVALGPSLLHGRLTQGPSCLYHIEAHRTDHAGIKHEAHRDDKGS